LSQQCGGGWNGGDKPEQRDRPSRNLPRPATIDRQILGKEKAPVGAFAPLFVGLSHPVTLVSGDGIIALSHWIWGNTPVFRDAKNGALKSDNNSRVIFSRREKF